MTNSKISIIIPAYNESRTVGDLVSKIVELYPEFEVLVINDSSTDDTSAVAKDAGAKVFSHPYNIGNGAAVKSGIRHASGDILVFIDRDLQHWHTSISILLVVLLIRCKKSETCNDCRCHEPGGRVRYEGAF